MQVTKQIITYLVIFTMCTTTMESDSVELVASVPCFLALYNTTLPENVIPNPVVDRLVLMIFTWAVSMTPPNSNGSGG